MISMFSSMDPAEEVICREHTERDIRLSRPPKAERGWGMYADDLLQESIQFRHARAIVNLTDSGAQLVYDFFTKLLLEFWITGQP